MQGATALPATFSDSGSTRINGVSILAEANNRFVSIPGPINQGSCLSANGTTVGPNQLFDFLTGTNAFDGRVGDTAFVAELTGFGVMADSTTSQVCENDAFPWFVYHY